MQIDLEAAARRYVRAGRSILAVEATVGVLLFAEAMDVTLSSPPSALGYQLFFLAMIAVGVCGWFAFLSTRLPPVKLQLDNRGCAFVSSDGTERRYRWDDPKLHLGLIDARFTKAALADPDRQAWLVRAEFGGVVRPTGVLTPEAFVALVLAAQAKGVSVTPIDWNEPCQGLRRVVLSNRRDAGSAEAAFPA